MRVPEVDTMLYGCAGLCQSVWKCLRAGQTQADTQRRAEVRLHHVWQGIQTAGSLVSCSHRLRFHSTPATPNRKTSTTYFLTYITYFHRSTRSPWNLFLLVAKSSSLFNNKLDTYVSTGLLKKIYS